MKIVQNRTFHLFIICLLFTACGYKTSPRPVTATVPTEIGLVDARAYPNSILLKWAIPTSNTDGSKASDLSGFKIFRSVQKVGEECEDCPIDRKMYANIDFQKPVDAVVSTDQVSYTDKSVSPGNIYTYSIAVYNLRGRESKPSQDVTISLDQIPVTPGGLQARRNQDGKVELEWEPLEKSSIQGYRIYRAPDMSPANTTLLGGKTADESRFLDDTAEKNETYLYSVRSFKMNRGVAVESEPSPALLVKPGFTPAPPKNVTVEKSQRGLRVSWDKSDVGDPEVAYNVYRSESGRIYVKINSEPIKDSKFDDVFVKRGTNYKYSITAFPLTDINNESAKSTAVDIEYRR